MVVLKSAQNCVSNLRTAVKKPDQSIMVITSQFITISFCQVSMSCLTYLILTHFVSILCNFTENICGSSFPLEILQNANFVHF